MNKRQVKKRVKRLVRALGVMAMCAKEASTAMRKTVTAMEKIRNFGESVKERKNC